MTEAKGNRKLYNRKVLPNIYWLVLVPDYLCSGWLVGWLVDWLVTFTGALLLIYLSKGS